MGQIQPPQTVTHTQHPHEYLPTENPPPQTPPQSLIITYPWSTTDEVAGLFKPWMLPVSFPTKLASIMTHTLIMTHTHYDTHSLGHTLRFRSGLIAHTGVHGAAPAYIMHGRPFSWSSVCVQYRRRESVVVPLSITSLPLS